MPVPGGETVQRRRGFTACRICGRETRQPIMAINGLIFCPEHAREFKRRRHEGASTAELDTAWGDTLKNWRERPPELDQETKPKFLATSFAFQEKDGPWLIFSRFYPEFERPRRSKPVAILRAKKGRGSISRRPRHRLSDCIAVNAQTGEIRRIGKIKAIVAVSHTVAVNFYHMITKRTPYQELGANYFDTLDRERLTKHTVKRLEALGSEVILTPKEVSA